MVSIAMAVYNGSMYLKEQLDSIKRQTIKPDEIVIVDDSSSEPSDDIIASFIEQSNINVKYIKHDINKGYAVTFFDAMMMTTGNIIFLSDQDDIWSENKIEKTLDLLMENKNIKCISSRNIFINSAGEEIGREKRKHSLLYNVPIDSLLTQRELRPGMSLAFTRDILFQLKEIDLSMFNQHDRLIELIACDKNCFFIVEEYLTKYRLHGNNTSGLNRGIKARIGLNDRAKKSLNEMVYLENILKQQIINSSSEDKVKAQIEFYRHRAKLLSNRSIIRYVFGMLPYYKRANGIRMIIGDINAILKG